MRRVAGPGAAPPMLDDTGDLGLSAEESQRIDRARGRFRLHRLLDAANAGAGTLDRVLIEMREDLEPSFFEHLQWEIEQQVCA